MKKLILLAVLFSSLASVAQERSYTYIAQRNEWLAGAFRALGLPAGNGPAAFQSGQRPWAGAVYYDSAGVDAGLYIYDGSTWGLVGAGSTTEASEGVTMSGDTVKLGGTTTVPAAITTERSTGIYNNSVVKMTSGYTDSTVGGTPFQYAYNPWSPFQFGRMDSIATSDRPLSVVPLTTMNVIRIIKYGTGGKRNYGIYGPGRFAYYHYAQDSAVIRSDGGDYNQSFIAEQRYRIDSNYAGTRTVIRTGHSSIASKAEGPAAIVANVYVDNNNAAKRIYVRGTLSAFMGYSVAGQVAPDTVERFVYYNTGSFFGGPNKILKTYAFSPTVMYGDSLWAFHEDQTTAYNYFKNGLSLGGGYTGIRNQFRNHYNTVLNDSVQINTMVNWNDSTNIDVVLSPRTAGGHALRKIRFDQLGTLLGGAGGITSVDAFSTAGDAEGMSITGSAIKLHAASGTSPGGVSIGTQDFSGNKTFNDLVTFQDELRANYQIRLRDNSGSGFYNFITSYPLTMDHEYRFADDEASTDTIATRGWARANISGGSAGTPALTQYRLAVGDASNLLSTGAAITGDRVLVSDANGVPTHSTVSTTKLEVATSEDPAYLDADFTLANSTSAQTAFPSTMDVYTVAANSLYEFEIMYGVSCGGTSSAMGFGISLGTATISFIAYQSTGWSGAVDQGSAAALNISRNAITPVAAMTAGIHLGKHILVKGTFRTGTGGTITPQVIFSADPTGTIKMLAGSYTKIIRKGSDTLTTNGNPN